MPLNFSYVKQALDLAFARYARKAITDAVEEEFYNIIQGIIPAIAQGLKTLVVTTLTGGALAGVFAGPEAIPIGASIGAAVGLAILTWMGLYELVKGLASNVTEIGRHFFHGAKIAAESNGDNGKIDEAAQELAVGIGILFKTIVDGLWILISKKGVHYALESVRKSKMGPSLNDYIVKKLSLNGYLKAIDKAPGEYVYTKDAQGRPSTAEGWLKRGDGKENKSVHDKVTAGRQGLNAAHLIPRQYLGDSIEDNLAATTARVNQSIIKIGAENEIDNLYNQVGEGKIYLKVTRAYKGNELEANELIHEVYVFDEATNTLVKKFEAHTPTFSDPSLPMGKVPLTPGSRETINSKDWHTPGPAGTSSQGGGKPH